MPIPAGESFPDPTDARTAAGLYRRLLELDPGRLDQPWLLNLAHMMAGDHPDSVPEPWRMPRDLFASEPGTTRTTASGLSACTCHTMMLRPAAVC